MPPDSRISERNGHPPHMIEIQNVMTTETIVHCISIGVGGVTFPPGSAK